jgi:hypothetical protein
VTDEVLTRLRELAAGAEPADEEQRLAGHWPPLLEGLSMTELSSPLFAAIVGAGAVLRETVTGLSLDPLAVLLRLLTLAFVVRALALGATLVQRVREGLASSKACLVLHPEALLLRLRGEDTMVPKAEMLAALEEGDWTKRGGRPRYARVFVVTGRDPVWIALPPIFDATPGRLAERLQRWRGAPGLPDEVPYPPPHESGNGTYEAVAAGRGPAGSLALDHGWSWLSKGPFAVVLLAVSALDGIVRSGPELVALVDPALALGLGLTLAVVPFVWAVTTRRNIASRLGKSMVLTPSEVLMRDQGTLFRVAWPALLRVEITGKRRYSLLRGAHEARTLVLHREDAPPIRYEEVYLGAPAEVVEALLLAYRQQRLPPQAASAEAARSS